MSLLATDALLPDSLRGARNLLGWKLIHKTAEGIASGYIVETEAYHQDDLASHSYGGERNRNAPMFRAAGTIYVYFTYGTHYCVNIVAGPAGRGEAVLIRALEPVGGIELMKKRRGSDVKTQLTNGPAKLVQALGITKAQNGTMIHAGPLRLESGFVPDEIRQTARVGISKAMAEPWRFYIANNPFVSKVPRL